MRKVRAAVEVSQHDVALAGSLAGWKWEPDLPGLLLAR
jgi:hypothetical protein